MGGTKTVEVCFRASRSKPRGHVPLSAALMSIFKIHGGITLAKTLENILQAHVFHIDAKLAISSKVHLLGQSSSNSAYDHAQAGSTCVWFANDGSGGCA